MKEVFVAKYFSMVSKKGLLSPHDAVVKAELIINEFLAKGFRLTLRQLYYQFVARGFIPNKQTEYKRLGGIISDARLAGIIDWSAIEDRERYMRGGENGFIDPSHAIQSVAAGYNEDFWPEQPCHVETWIEKNALIGVIEPACSRWRLPYLGCRGYVSQSTQYEAGKRFARIAAEGKRVVVLYMGDHDPSGMDMTRDHQDRLDMFMRRWPVEVRRLALNMDQIEEYDPPPNPAKETDSRSAPYIAQFGESSWELDALDPTVIDQLIEDQMQELVDHDQWKASEDKESDNRDMLVRVYDRWDEIKDFLGEE